MRNRGTVLSEIKVAVAEERECQLRVLKLLREVEADEHYLEMGYPSLFEFATRELGYSAGAAHRRIQSMRLLKTAPQMEAKIQDGSLSLCVAAKTQSFLKDQKLSLECKQEIIESMVGTSARECERRLADLSPAAALPSEKTRALPNEKTPIQFVASPELLEKLQELKNLLAHQSDGSYEQLFEKLAELAIRKLKPKEPSSFPTLEKSKTRYIPVAVKQEVWARDQGKCTYADPATGRRCESRHKIQYDHIQPYAWGGETSVQNLRLRCRAHNSYTARMQGLRRS